MIDISTPLKLKEARQLDFCYLCGKKLLTSDATDRDHVPPKSVFLKEDRTPPLILSTHEDCNNENSVDDKQIGQLVNLIHGIQPHKQNLSLKFDEINYEETGKKLVGLRDMEFQMIVWRWIRGFHSALYRTFIPSNTHGVLQAPFPGGKPLVTGGFPDQFIPQILQIIAILKRNRGASNVDRIVSFNNKCHYECVWVKDPTLGCWACLFGLQVYEWEALGDNTNFMKRGCAGAYYPARGLPVYCAVDTPVVFRYSNESPLTCSVENLCLVA